MGFSTSMHATFLVALAVAAPAAGFLSPGSIVRLSGSAPPFLGSSAVRRGAVALRAPGPARLADFASRRRKSFIMQMATDLVRFEDLKGDFEIGFISALPDASEGEMEELLAIFTATCRSVERRLKRQVRSCASPAAVMWESLASRPPQAAHCPLAGRAGRMTDGAGRHRALKWTSKRPRAL
jgi:hypothetical protein